MSYNYSYKYLRHYNYLGYIASDGGSNAWDAASLWNEDSTWAIASPWINPDSRPPLPGTSGAAAGVEHA